MPPPENSNTVLEKVVKQLVPVLIYKLLFDIYSYLTLQLVFSLHRSEKKQPQMNNLKNGLVKGMFDLWQAACLFRGLPMLILLSFIIVTDSYHCIKFPQNYYCQIA